MSPENEDGNAVLRPFVESFPVQTMSLGIVLAFGAVMFFHLIFTTPYHYPISKHNFVLQFISSVLFLLNASVSLGVVLRNLKNVSSVPPHEFPYMAEYLPPIDPNTGTYTWSNVSLAFFIIMQSCTVFVAHVCCESDEVHTFAITDLIVPVQARIGSHHCSFRFYGHCRAGNVLFPACGTKRTRYCSRNPGNF